MKPNETERNEVKRDGLIACIADAFEQFDETEKLIWFAGLHALNCKALNLPEFIAWTQERFDRHRAGEELRLSDLETPPHPNAESDETTAGLPRLS